MKNTHAFVGPETHLVKHACQLREKEETKVGEGRGKGGGRIADRLTCTGR